MDISQKSERSEAIQYAIYSLGLLDLECGSLGEAGANLDRALAMSETIGAKASTALTLVAHGELNLQLGDLSAAEACLLRAFEGAKVVGDDLLRINALCGLAEARARRILEEEPRPSSTEKSPEGTMVAGDGSEWAPGLSRRPDLHSPIDARDGVAPPAAALPQGVGSRDDLGPLLEGEPSEWADQAYRDASAIEGRQVMVRADLACSLARIAAGDPAGAIERATRAIALCDECGFRPDKARALLYAGMAHARAGDLSAAEESLRESRALADEIGLAVVRTRVRIEQGLLAERRAKEIEARALFAEAAELINAMARTLPDPDQRLRFISTGWHGTALERCAAPRHSSPVGATPEGTSGEIVGSQSQGPDLQPERPVEARADSSPEEIPRPTLRRRSPDEPRAESSDGAHAGSGLTPEASSVAKARAEAAPSSRAEGVEEDPLGPTDHPQSPRDLRATVTLLLEEALRSIACDRGLVFLIAPDGTSEIVVARGLEAESITDARSYCRSVVDRAAHGEEILAVDASRDERFRDRRSVSLFHIVSIVCVPLKIAGRVMGALYLDSRAGGRLLRENDLARARAIGARMASSIRAAWETERKHEEALLKQRALCQTYRLDAIIGEAPTMQKMFRVLEAVIASDCNVLVVGESGAGKELAARAIHFSGRRKMAPFVTVDCGALPDSLVESEMFGYRKGAFTGADMDRRGLFEEADGGTLFLDEITNTSTLFQAKLLRVLQAGEFRRVGDTTPRKVDVRIIAATNADLEEAMRAGRFREDLFYRLNVVNVRMPPLRERAQDVPLLAEQFARAFCRKESIPYRGIGEAALKRLREHSWPGNVRELKNAVESALVLSRDGAVRREFLPEPLRGGSFEEIRDLLRDGASMLEGEAGGAAPAGQGSQDRPAGWLDREEERTVRDDDDRARIEDALNRAGGDKSRAAGILGWSRMTLYRKMRRLGIDYGTGRPDAPASS